MNILVSTSAFKDTYTSIEFCELLQEILDQNNHIEIAPFCDGGEYTLDVLSYYFKPEIYYIHNIYNCYLKLIDVPYLILNGQVYLFTSEIIKLSNLEQEYKNPLKLSDYGVGQTIAYLYKEGYRMINLCIGGTSTVCCGAGAAQALGVQFFDINGIVIDNIVCGEDLKRIHSYDVKENQYTDLQVRIIADGDIDFNKMSSVSKLKVSEELKNNEKEEVLENIEEGVQWFANNIAKERQYKYTGAAGGIIIGIRLIIAIDLLGGSDFFSKLFHISDKIKAADIVITGEGTLDNSACGKGPFEVLKIAKQYQKKTIYIVGSADNTYLQDIQTGVVCNSVLKNSGIDILLNCQYMYSNIESAVPYHQKMDIYRMEMPQILKRLFKEINL